jgi:hypothetical protein
MSPDDRRLEELLLKRRLAKVKLERALERRAARAKARAKWDRWELMALAVCAQIGVVAVVLVLWSHFSQRSTAPPVAAPSTTTVTATPPTMTPPPQYQEENDVDRFLRHAHALGIKHHQGDGALVATGMRICDAVRKGTPVPSVVLGFTEVFAVQDGVNQKDADAFAWYAIDDLCGDALPPGGYCVEGGFWNGTTATCMSDNPTQSPPGATVTLPTSPVVPRGSG